MPTKDIENRSWKNLYLRGTLIIISGLLLSVVIFFAGLLGWLNQYNDPPQLWFQRSGSMMTLVLLVADYYVIQLNNDLSKNVLIPEHAFKTKRKYWYLVKKLTYIAVIFTLLATFIWGYGDIVYCQINVHCS